MMKALDIQWTLVPFQGGGSAMQALLSGDADVTMGFPSTLAGQMASGDVRVLATAGAERIYEDVPTFAEVGVEGDVGFMHRVVMAPADTPAEVLTQLEEAFAALEVDKTFTRMMGRLGENVDIINGEAYQEMRVEHDGAYKVLVEQLTAQ